MKASSKRDLWREGEYIDLWSLVHLLSGVVAGFVPIITSLSFGTGLVIFFILTILWEVFEYLLGIIESTKNSIVDIIIGNIGFAGTSLVVSFGYNDADFIETSLVAAVVALIILSLRGWHAFWMRSRT